MLRISVVYAPAPRVLKEIKLQLALGSTALQALQASGLLHALPETDVPSTVIGIWGRKVDLAHVLRDQDRVEIYRPLTVDPKVARRQRFVKQGTKGAGLFAKKRAGAAAGY